VRKVHELWKYSQVSTITLYQECARGNMLANSNYNGLCFITPAWFCGTFH